MPSTPLPVIANTYRCAFKWTTDSGQHAINVMHFLRAGGTALDVKNDIVANWTRAMIEGSSSLSSIKEIDIIKLDGSSATVSFPVSGTQFQGNQTGGDWTPAAAIMVKMQTGLRGRNHRGRIFQPFIAENAGGDGIVGTTVQADEQAAWTAFLAAMTVATCFPVVARYDRKNGGAGAGQSLITGYVVESAMGTMRKRQGRLR